MGGVWCEVVGVSFRDAAIAILNASSSSYREHIGELINPENKREGGRERKVIDQLTLVCVKGTGLDCSLCCCLCSLSLCRCVGGGTSMNWLFVIQCN